MQNRKKYHQVTIFGRKIKLLYLPPEDGLLVIVKPVEKLIQWFGVGLNIIVVVKYIKKLQKLYKTLKN